MRNELAIVNSSRSPIRNYLLTKEIQKQWEKAKYIKEELSTSPDFDNVLDINAFQARSMYENIKNPSGIMLMLDGNYMKQIIKSKGDPAVDLMLRNMIIQIREVLAINNIKHYHIGKRGDEFYIYIPQEKEVSQEEKQKRGEKLMQEFSVLKAEDLTMSVGYTADLSQGIEKAMKAAELEMKKQKNMKKQEDFDKGHEDNAEEVVMSWINTIAAETRQNIEILTHQQKRTLSQNIRESLIAPLINPQEIHQKMKERDLKRKAVLENQPEGLVFKRAKEIQRELELRYQGLELPLEFIEDVVEAQLISKLPIQDANIQRMQYFNKIGSKGLESSDSKKTFSNLEKKSLIYIDVGKIKEINKSGYNFCDQLAVRDLKAIQQMAEKSGMKDVTFVAKGISPLMLIFPRDTEVEVIKEFKEQLQELEQNSEFTFNCSSILPMVKDEKEKEIFSGKSPEAIVNSLIGKRRIEGKKEAELISANKKVNDKLAIQEAVIDCLEMIQENPIIQNYIKSHLKEGQNERIVMERLIDKALTILLKVQNETGQSDKKTREGLKDIEQSNKKEK